MIAVGLADLLFDSKAAVGGQVFADSHWRSMDFSVVMFTTKVGGPIQSGEPIPLPPNGPAHFG